MRRRWRDTLPWLAALLLTGACSGGLTGEIGGPSCETPVGVVDLDEAHPEIGESPRARLDARGAPLTAPVTWTDGSTTMVTLTLEAAPARSRDVVTLEGEMCAPFYRAPIRLRVVTADGRLDHTFEGDADLHALETFAWLEAQTEHVEGFDPAAYAPRFDPEQARLRVGIRWAEGASIRGLLELEPGVDGEEKREVASW